MSDRYSQLVDRAFGSQISEPERRRFAARLRNDVRAYFAVVAVMLVGSVLSSIFTGWRAYIDQYIPFRIPEYVSIIGQVIFSTGLIIYGLVHRVRFPKREILYGLQEMGLQQSNCMECDHALDSSAGSTCPCCGAQIASIDGQNNSGTTTDS